MKNYNMSNYRMMPPPNMMPCPQMKDRMEYSQCDGETNCLEMNYALAMAYVPWQKFDALLEPEKAFEVGTIFTELEKPFWGKRGMMR